MSLGAIRPIDFTFLADLARHDRMVALVECMLDLHKKLASEGAPHVKNVLQRQIEATDREIDRLVYELYGLSDDEIAIVEAGEASQSSYQAIDQFAATGYNDYREIRTEEQAMHTLAIEYPPEVLWALQQEPEEFEDDARLLLAVKLYEGGRLSTGMAAKLAGIPRSAFIFLLGRYKLSPFGQSPDDLEDDLANARRASYPQ